MPPSRAPTSPSATRTAATSSTLPPPWPAGHPQEINEEYDDDDGLLKKTEELWSSYQLNKSKKEAACMSNTSLLVYMFCTEDKESGGKIFWCNSPEKEWSFAVSIDLRLSYVFLF
ncbi:hypothetical protein SETIT_9G085400v2 [Setaria italica]|uniref:Uncharacterized protein n=1 Tax=Setaria italica TaxID=4555 RepID=A0A368SEF1_SETIT|nr:hypothetical protein SETIT_9G085400v2 [Setaria italica]